MKHRHRQDFAAGRAVPFMSARLKPRLAFAVFRRYPRRRVVLDPAGVTSPTDPRALSDLRSVRRIGFPHHH